MNVLDGERVITSVEVYKETKDIEDSINTIGSIVVGVLLGGLGGEIPTKFNLILTEKHLCIEAIGLSAWGRLPETKYIEKIALTQVGTFMVTSEEGRDLVTIGLKNNKQEVFLRKNEKQDTFMYEVEKQINEMIA